MSRPKALWTGKLSKFGIYLQTHKLERDKVAKAAGITPSYVSMLAHAKATPGLALASRISAWTAAEVKDEKGEPAPFRCEDWGL